MIHHLLCTERTFANSGEKTFLHNEYVRISCAHVKRSLPRLKFFPLAEDEGRDGKGGGARVYPEEKGGVGREEGRERAEKDVCFKKSGRRRESYLFAEKTMMETSARLLSRGKERALQNTLQVFFPEGDGSRVSFPFLWERDIPRHPEKTIFKFPSPSPLHYDPVFQCQGLRLRPLGERAETRFFFSPRCKHSFTRKSAQKSMKTHMGSTGKNVGFLSNKCTYTSSVECPCFGVSSNRCFLHCATESWMCL